MDGGAGLNIGIDLAYFRAYFRLNTLTTKTSYICDKLIPTSYVTLISFHFGPDSYIANAAMSSAGIASVDAYTKAVESLLARSRKIKPIGGIEPALTFTDLSSEIERFIPELSGREPEVKAEMPQTKQARFAAIETAFRNVFCDLLVRSTRIHLSCRS